MTNSIGVPTLNDLDKIPPRPTRGYPEAGGGWAGPVSSYPSWLASTRSVAHLYPFGPRSAGPLLGVPLGYDIWGSGHLVCYDPWTWYKNGRIRAAQQAIVAANGVGKSTLAKRECLGMSWAGVPPVMAGDTKGEYVGLIAAMGGTVAKVGPGAGSVNVTDPVGILWHIAELVDDETRAKALEEFRQDRTNLVSGLLEIARNGDALTASEEAVLALVLFERDLISMEQGSELTLGDALQICREPTERLLEASSLTAEQWAERSKTIEQALWAFVSNPSTKTMFCRPSTVSVDVAHGLVVDLSSIPDSSPKLVAQAMMTAWALGLQAIESYRLVRPNQVFHMVFDELWRLLDSLSRHRVDAQLRLDRHRRLVTTLITHTSADLLDGTDNLLSRVATAHIGAQAESDLKALVDVLSLTPKEKDLLQQWQVAGTTKKATGGAGKFLLKTGPFPGVPYKLKLTETEKLWTDTNQMLTGSRTVPKVKREPSPTPKRRRHPVPPHPPESMRNLAKV